MRRQVHAAVDAVGHGSIVTVSRGVGDERYVSVVHRGSDAARQQVRRPAQERRPWLLLMQSAWAAAVTLRQPVMNFMR